MEAANDRLMAYMRARTGWTDHLSVISIFLLQRLCFRKSLPSAFVTCKCNMGFIEELIGAPSVTEEQRQAAVQRILSDPGIPDCKNTTAPFWLEEPHPRISKAGSTTVPKDVDILIIGSGITAASVARSIFKVKGSAAPRVAIIEARDICSGATGRNGGHVNEGVVHSYLELVGALGKENAMKIVRFRLGHLPMLLQVAQEDGLLEESQIRTVTSVVVFFDDEEFSKSKANLAQFKTDMPQESAAFYIFEAEDAQKVNTPQPSKYLSSIVNC